ncbi:MAG: MarC family protein [Gemmatimonadaceae bacterium]
MPGTEQVAFALLAFTSLLAIVNPISAIPIYVALTGALTAERRRTTLRTATITGVLVLAAFGLLGTWILRFFGITTDAFRITGGLLFVGIGSDMLAARRSRVKTTPLEEEEAEHREDVGIIPLGLPTLAGPGAITTVVTLVAQARSPVEHGAVYVAIIAVMAITWVVLSVAPLLLHRFGNTGLNVLTRVMGLLVMVIGMQFIINGTVNVLRGVLARP